MSRKPGDSYYTEFTTANFSTGVAQTADSLPVATANHNGTDDGAFALTVTLIDTGRYKISGTVPSSYAAGDTVIISISATVGGVAGKGAVDSFMIDAKRVSDLNDVSNALIQSDLAGAGFVPSGTSLPVLGKTYCSQTEINAVWSAFGVNVRLDDDLDGVADQDVAAIIEQASSRMNRFLFRRYTALTISACTWAKWCCAAMAAAIIARRRGNDIPQSLVDEVKDYQDALTAIGDGREDLPADDGPATPKWDETPAFSNLTIDGRFTRAKVRRVPSTSSGGPQSANGRMQNNSIDYALWE